MKTVIINGLRFIEVPALEKQGVVHAFSTIDIGKSHPAAHARIRSAFPKVNELATAKQVHGNNVIIVDVKTRAATSRHIHADVIISKKPGVAPAVRTADCAPVLLADPGKRVAAAVHAGWRGVAADASGAAVSAMQELGCDPADILAAIGPAIGPCHYQVDRPVIQAIKAALPGASDKVLFSQSRGKAKLDLPGANGIMLARAGVPRKNIHLVRACTFCLPELFFSYRRQGPGAPSLYHFILPHAH